MDAADRRALDRKRERREQARAKALERQKADHRTAEAERAQREERRAAAARERREFRREGEVRRAEAERRVRDAAKERVRGRPPDRSQAREAVLAERKRERARLEREAKLRDAALVRSVADRPRLPPPREWRKKTPLPARDRRTNPKLPEPPASPKPPPRPRPKTNATARRQQRPVASEPRTSREAERKRAAHEARRVEQRAAARRLERRRQQLALTRQQALARAKATPKHDETARRRRETALKQRAADRKAERERSMSEAERAKRQAAARALERRAHRRAVARQEAIALAQRGLALARRLADLDELRRSTQAAETAAGNPRQRFPNGPRSGALGWLRADGRQLRDELDRPTQLRGVTARWFERAEPSGQFFEQPITRDELGLLQRWGATALTVPIAQDLALVGRGEALGAAYLQALDTTIAAAADAGLYTIVQLSLISSVLPTHAGPVGTDRFDPALPNAQSVDLWSMLAQRYAGEAAVLYDLFRSPHDPQTGDSLRFLLPRITWPVWADWLLSMLGAVRRAAPRSVVVMRGLGRGTDLSGFPLRYTDGTLPANVVYGAELGLDDGGGALTGLARLGRDHPVGAFTWRADPQAPRAVELVGRRLARAGYHWIAADWTGNAMPLVERSRDRELRPTGLGRSFAVAFAQPDPPSANTAANVPGRRPGAPADVSAAEPPPRRDPFAPPGAEGNRWARYGTDGAVPAQYRDRLNQALALAYGKAREPTFQEVFSRVVGKLTGQTLGPDACIDALDKAILHMAETAHDPRAVRQLAGDREAARLDPTYQQPPAFSIVGGRDVWIREAQLQRPATALAGTFLHEAAHLAGARADMIAEVAIEAIHNASYPRQ